ncbi:hypothetical protein [Iocasia frigidifontis]|nr:hypothetical protein [Iocasia fonsfrigidae]
MRKEKIYYGKLMRYYPELKDKIDDKLGKASGFNPGAFLIKALF